MLTILTTYKKLMH